MHRGSLTSEVASKAQDGDVWKRLSLDDAFGTLDWRGELPSDGSVTCILQKCRKSKDVAVAKLVHTHMCNYGLENHTDVGNYIVPMYVECGSLADAQKVFNRLTHRNEHSWTSLIVGYIQCGQLQHAFNLYQEMLKDSVHPSSFTFVPLLKACTTLKDVERGREIHSQIAVKEIDRYLFVSSTLVSMYAKCGSFLEAQELFVKLQIQDVVSWNALIAGYVEHGPSRAALRCFDQMQLEGVAPNAITFAYVLKACGSLGLTDMCREIHMEILQKGIEGDRLVSNILVDMYAKHVSVSEAQEIFDKVPDQDVMLWNTLIAGYAEKTSSQEALNCLEQMQKEGISPTVVTLMCVNKMCYRMEAINEGQEIYILTTLQGLEGDLFMGSALVDMYVNCGSILEAWEVFARLPTQDVVSWNAIMAGHLEKGPRQEVLECFQQMQLEAISPNAVTLSFLLKAFCNMDAEDKCQEIYTEIIFKGFERDPFVGSNLVDMYAKCGSILEAKQTFDRLIVQDVVSWTALISGYSEHGIGHEALEHFEQMQREGAYLDAVTCVSVLKACGSIGSTKEGLHTHIHIMLHGYEKHLMVGNALIDMYVKCDLLLEAQEVFDRLAIQDVISCNALIFRYAEHGSGQEALDCFKQMQLKAIAPDSVTFFGLLKACGSIGALIMGKEIHAEIVDKGLEREPSIGGALVDMYAKCGAFLELKSVCASWVVQDILSWNGLIAGYAEHGGDEEALEHFEQMQLECVSPDVVTFACILKSCSNIGAIKKGQEMYVEIVQLEYERDIYIVSLLISMYAKGGLISEAEEVFARQSIRDSVTWCALLAGYADHGPVQEALNCFEQMQQEGVAPDAGTFVCVVNACSIIGAIDQGRKVHMQIVEKEFERYPLVGNSLVDMYGKCCSIADAQEVFERLPGQDIVSRNAMIAGYAINHGENMAQKQYEDMQALALKPNAVTFLCLLTACSQACLLSEGQKYFKVMRKEYCITPTIEHYNCMIDLFARSGHLCEAEKFLESIPCPLSEGTWRTVLGGCKAYGGAELGLRCFQQLVQINPENASSYVLMSDTYSSAGKMDAAYKVEKQRIFSRAPKKPGRALIDVNNKVHEFVVGTVQGQETLAMLEILTSQLKRTGHVPNLDLILMPISD